MPVEEVVACGADHRAVQQHRLVLGRGVFASQGKAGGHRPQAGILAFVAEFRAVFHSLSFFALHSGLSRGWAGRRRVAGVWACQVRPFVRHLRPSEPPSALPTAPMHRARPPMSPAREV